jgi:hypothetical protein
MDKLLNVFIERRSELAHVALSAPKDGTEFEYGRMVGRYQGLTIAIEAVQDMLADKEKDE